MFGHLLKRGAAMLCFAAVLALPAYAEGRITTDMTMKEIRSDPAIAGSGVFHLLQRGCGQPCTAPPV